jgi:NAD-dependent deacetylase
MSDAAATLARWIAEAHSAVAFTGAGISTESGIPDFRSPNGVWARYRPVMFGEFVRSADARHEYWRQKAEAHPDMAAARPNNAHLALARWEAAGRLRGVITQNIDGLHQEAGSRAVLELHGTAREVGCLECRARFPADGMVAQFQTDGRAPDCPQCGGMLKHATISFGQALDREVLHQAVVWSQSADVFLAIGSSLVVAPASALPLEAKQAGARLAIVNREETPLDAAADVVVRSGIGEFFEQLEAALRDGH